MYTVEHEFNGTVITTLDQNCKQEDVEVHLDEQSVFFRQWSEEIQGYDLIEMSMQQLKDIVSALNSPEGAYYAK
jgi:hypothetical protein